LLTFKQLTHTWLKNPFEELGLDVTDRVDVVDFVGVWELLADKEPEGDWTRTLALPE